ncbi:MAG: hypothetical protein NTW74_07450 [Acidobacteria bacterium]|nr:hypothetical protein [Acidobacteriota bacterium]
MMPLLSLFLLLAATNDPLPKELEYRLSLARALPAPYSGAVIVALLPSAKLSSAQIVPLAQEAYELAGKDTAVALRAWIAYRDNFDKEKDVALAFPLRSTSVKAGCDALEVSDPRDYYRWALQAGSREFGMATRNVRSAVEVGRLAEALLEGGSEQQVLAMSSAMIAATGSDREFVEAIRYTALHNSVIKLSEKLSANAARLLLGNYRTFLTTNLSGRRCAGNRSEEFKGVFEEFNQAAMRVRGVVPLRPEAAQVNSVDTTTRDVMPNTFALAHKVTNAPADDTSVQSMLTEISQFRLEQKPGTTGSAEESKAYLYGRFAERMAANPMQDRVMEDWIHFVAHSSLRDANPKVWFRSARSFYDWSRKSAIKQSKVEAAGDPALTAYIKLTVLLPESEVARVLP